MVVHITTRHKAGCKYADDSQAKRCHCVRWVSYTINGKQIRETTGARSWEKATVFARGIELRYEQADAPRPKPTTPATIAQAVTAYIADKRAQHLSDSTIRKRVLWFEKELVPWARAAGIHYVRDLTVTHLREWRSTWKLGPLSSQKKQEAVRQFIGFCIASGWASENPAKALSKIKVRPKPTDYFTDAEMDRILAVASPKLRPLVLLMRWSGLAIRDAVTLERERLNAENQIFLYRAKTGTAVHVTIPPDVADELRAVPIVRTPRYFFWSGNGKPQSAVGHWTRKFQLLFIEAGLRYGDGKLKRAHPHMLRDTFAVNLLLVGVPLEDVQLYLGHSSIRTTELHYAPFVQARMDRMDSNLKAAWERRI